MLKNFVHYCTAVISAVCFRFPARKLTVIGVTGTDGKTTTSTLIYEILKHAGKNVSMITSVCAVVAGKSYDTGFHVTTPSAWHIQKFLRDAVDHGDTHFVLEVTSHALDQFRVWGIPFQVGVITNVTREHLDWHKTFENYLRSKLRLFSQSRMAVVNKDDAHTLNAALPLLTNKPYRTYAIRRDAQVTPSKFRMTPRIPGEFNRYNCLAAAAAAQLLGIPDPVIRSTIHEFPGISGRMEILREKPFRVIVDFAHTPNAIGNALATARKMTKNRLIHVFGSAGLRDAGKRPLMGAASAKFADIIVITEEDYRTEDVHAIIDAVATGIPPGKTTYRIPKRGDAIRQALSLAGPGDTVILTGKGHERSLCRGTTEFPWSDQKAVAEYFSSSSL